MSDLFQRLDEKRPVVHVLTNYVTVKDVVNIILASGAAAICADAPEEATDITSLCDGLLINLGTPSVSKAETMLLSGRRANEKGIPVMLDPVGAGASDFRRRILQNLLHGIRFTCVRGNMSEIAALSHIAFTSRGVEDAGVEVSVSQMQALAQHYRTVVVATGEVDYVTDGHRVFESEAGTPLQKKITGSGCMLSGLIAAALTAGESDVFRTVCTAVQAYGQCAQAAEQDLKRAGRRGTGSFLTALIDRVSLLSEIPGADDDFPTSAVSSSSREYEAPADEATPADSSASTRETGREISLM